MSLRRNCAASSKVVERTDRDSDRSGDGRGGVQRPEEVVKGVRNLTKAHVFRLTMVVGGVAAAVAAFAAPLKW